MHLFNSILLYVIFTNLVVFIIILVNFICILIATAFLTLFERKVLGAIQKRKGPNVTGLLGFLQAISDGLKLVSKETIIPSRSDTMLFIIAPVVVFVVSLSIWAIIPIFPSSFISNLNIGLVLVFALSLLVVYGLLLAGWASNSRLSFYGSLRSVAQMLAYDLAIGLNLLLIVIYTGSLNLSKIVQFQDMVWIIFLSPWSAGLFLICILAELKRLPFDLPEAESELVSGYNTEYSGLLFAFFFLAEYSSLVLFANLYTILYLGGWSRMSWLENLYDYSVILDFFCYNLKVIFILFFFLALRGTVTRYRYDSLMELGWKFFIPASIAVLILAFCLATLFDVSCVKTFSDLYNAVTKI